MLQLWKHPEYPEYCSFSSAYLFHDIRINYLYSLRNLMQFTIINEHIIKKNILPISRQSFCGTDGANQN